MHPKNAHKWLSDLLKEAEEVSRHLDDAFKPTISEMAVMMSVMERHIGSYQKEHGSLFGWRGPVTEELEILTNLPGFKLQKLTEPPLNIVIYHTDPKTGYLWKAMIT
jgi:hypothetical protein